MNYSDGAAAVSAHSSNLGLYRAQHLDEDCGAVTGDHENELFFNCTIRSLRDVLLKGCNLHHSKLDIQKPADVLGATVTIDCNTFADVEFSPLLFDLFIVLLTKTKGNNAKRRQLIDVIGRQRWASLLQEMSTLE